MLNKIKSIHPGWFIGGFFVVLIVFNAVFFAIAASTPVDLIPRHPPRQSVLEPAAAPSHDAGGPEVSAPGEPAAER